MRARRPSSSNADTSLATEPIVIQLMPSEERSMRKPASLGERSSQARRTEVGEVAVAASLSGETETAATRGTRRAAAAEGWASPAVLNATTRYSWVIALEV